jgi:class 3 adenylate cyclase
VATFRRRPLSQPDERREIRDGQLNFFDMGDGVVGYALFRPGWRWSTHVKPSAGTDYCDFHHLGFSVSGRIHVQHRDGPEMEIGPQEFFEIPPFHDAWVVGDEPWVSIDWGSEVAFGREEGAAASRLVSTLLFTDIVDSTAMARELGDARWRTVLARHNQAIRRVLERYRGREAATTGDGFLALFDSAEAAAHAGLAVAGAVEALGIRVRCGIHTGEVELEAGNVRGLAVHAASRVLALAGPGEVLVSWTTRDLLAGTRLEFESRGTHELKGLPEPRPVYSISQRATA